MPDRIQRKRTSGWKMPAGAVYVGRPGKWGNPFAVGKAFPFMVDGRLRPVVPETIDECVELYEKRLRQQIADGVLTRDDFEWLRGKDLACWCGLSSPCHADVLLKIMDEIFSA